MIEVSVFQGERKTKINGKEQESMWDTLIRNHIYFSAVCGGKGTCGKCKVHFLYGAPVFTATECNFFDKEKLEDGWRLACLSLLEKNCGIELESKNEMDFEVVSSYGGIDDEVGNARENRIEEPGYYIGIDIGTTTVAINLIGKASGTIYHTYTTVNRQCTVGTDVISRIQASNEGKGEWLTESIRKELYDGIKSVVAKAKVDLGKVEKIAIAGNTTMLHLLMGFSCETLGIFPFTPVNVNTIETSFEHLFTQQMNQMQPVEQMQQMKRDKQKIPCRCLAKVTLLPGISTFVGADITAGMFACGFDKLKNPSLLLDLGTNGEMALGNKDKIMVTSTAAGPAFEGGNISCGMGSVQGAICNVELGNEIHITTIGNKPPIGLCGTGVVETVYELMHAGFIDDTGAFDTHLQEDGFKLAETQKGEPIVFTQKDIREVQLAKSAVRAGIETLLIRYGITYKEVDTVFLAGGFGYKINLEKAVGIGMIPKELERKIVTVGNSSLGGAIAYLSETNAIKRMEDIIYVAEEIELSMDKDFREFYMDYMFF
ncbi:ASKHA domain-containing protein [Lachnospiraceae bacterium ZAX-1]